MAPTRPSLRSVLTALVPVFVLLAAGTVWGPTGIARRACATKASVHRRILLQVGSDTATSVVAQTFFNLYGPATSALDPSTLEKALVALSNAAGVSDKSSTLTVTSTAPYSFHLRFSFVSDSVKASFAQDRVKSAINGGALPDQLDLAGDTTSTVSQAIVSNPSGSSPPGSNLAVSSHKSGFPVWAVVVVTLLALFVISLLVFGGCLLCKRRMAQPGDGKVPDFISRPHNRVFEQGGLPTYIKEIKLQSQGNKCKPAASPLAESPYRAALRESIEVHIAIQEPAQVPRRLSHLSSTPAM